MILHSHQLATKHACLASTGILTLTPGSTNTIPGSVQFSLDIRAGDDDRLMRLEDQLKIDFEKIAKNEAIGVNEGGTLGRGCTVEWFSDASSEAVKFHSECIRCVEDSAKDLFGVQYETLTYVLSTIIIIHLKPCGSSKSYPGSIYSTAPVYLPRIILMQVLLTWRWS